MAAGNLAVITARGGSKRIPRKNIRPFLCKPIIAYSIEAAVQCGLFETVMVSTDDHEIAGISRELGAEVPFLRSDATSDDFAGTAEVLAEVLRQYERSSAGFDLGCCIYPTAPLVTIKRLKESHELMRSGSYDTVFPVCEFGYPIDRSLALDNLTGRVNMRWPENLHARSQDLPAAYHDAGQFYWFRPEKIIAGGRLFTDNSAAIRLSRLEVQDIDTEEDWAIAELKYSVLYRGE